MKKFFNSTKSPVIICILAIVILLISFCVLFVMHQNAEANLGKQQQWTSDKDSFDRAFEIAVSDKETPDKTLYVPKIKDQIGKTIDQAVQNIGQGANVVSSTTVGGPNDKIVTETLINLTNESSSDKYGTTHIVAGTDKNGRIVKISFSCNILLLGYKSLSYTDLVNNEHLIEKTLTEAGLPVQEGSVTAPADKFSYTSYDSDGTTVTRECCSFSGKEKLDSTTYKWDSVFDVDYSLANQKGDLSSTVRIITITIEK